MIKDINHLQHTSVALHDKESIPVGPEAVQAPLQMSKFGRGMTSQSSEKQRASLLKKRYNNNETINTIASYETNNLNNTSCSDPCH
jgi:hypothetical protein